MLHLGAHRKDPIIGTAPEPPYSRCVVDILRTDLSGCLLRRIHAREWAIRQSTSDFRFVTSRVGVSLITKAMFQPKEVSRLYLPVREQAHSHRTLIACHQHPAIAQRDRRPCRPPVWTKISREPWEIRPASTACRSASSALPV